MSQATVRIPMPLRGFTGGADELTGQGSTVGDVLRDLGTSHQGLLERILDADGELRSFVNVYVDDTNVRSMEGLASSVHEGAVIHILPAVAGGGGR